MNLVWKTIELPIGEFIVMVTDPMSVLRIDVDPIGQRPDIESLLKKQGILDTVFRGYDFGELKLRTLENDPEFKYRSIDGGHRKRAIRDFVQGKFKLGKNTQCFVDGKIYDISGKFYKELPLVVKEFLGAYKMRFTIYGSEMTDEQAGETFRRTNITTDVNHQEMLNSYEDNLVSKFVREISRPIRGLGNKYHDLFEYTSLDIENRKQRYFQSASTRLRDDEFVSRLLTMLIKSPKNLSWLTSSNKEMEDTFVSLGDKVTGVWAKDKDLAKTHQRMVIDALDFIQNYVDAKKLNSKVNISTQEFTLVSRLYVYLVRMFTRKGFKIADYEKLYLSVRGAMDRFVGRDENNLRLDTHKDSKGIRTVCECFRQYLTVHDDQKRCELSVKWLLEEMDMNDCGIQFKDTKRDFPAEMVEQVWRNQGCVCWVTGLPLNIKDAVGAHIIAHSQGGSTTIDNCVVCHKDENSRMGSMDAVMYRAMRLAEMRGEKELVTEF